MVDSSENELSNHVKPSILDSSDSDSLVISEKVYESSHSAKRKEVQVQTSVNKESFSKQKHSSAKRTFSESTNKVPESDNNSDISACGSFITVEENRSFSVLLTM